MGSIRTRRGRAVLALLPAMALTATSFSLAAEERRAKLDAGKQRVEVGKPVMLRGSFDGAPGASLEIRFRPAGAKSFRKVKTTTTGPNGGFRVRVRPRGSGRWLARLSQASAGRAAPAAETQPAELSDAEYVRVRSRTEAKVGDRHVVRGRKVRVKGRVRPGNAGRKVVIRVGGKRYATRTDRDGRFSRRVPVAKLGKSKVRVRAKGDAVAAGSRAKAGAIFGYRPAQASYYGPGFYGNRTACGTTLTTSTIGVAHKTMPCGTRLRLMLGNRVVRARVIDRGPYHGGREFDLTAATKQRLGFGSTGTVYVSR